MITIPIAPVLGSLLFLFTGIMITGHSGIEFDPERNRFRSYTSVFFIKFGKWKVSDRYPYIYILRSVKYSGDTPKQGEEKESRRAVDIILTDAAYRKKILLAPNYPEDEGRQAAARLAELLGKEFVAYGPKRHPGNSRRNR